MGPRLASLLISVWMGLVAVTASADPQSRTAELLNCSMWSQPADREDITVVSEIGEQ